MRLILLVFWGSYARPADAVEVWLQPWFGCVPCHNQGQVDANELFDQTAPWPTAMSQVNVIAFTAWWLSGMSDIELSGAIAWMKAHDVAMALEIEGLPTDPNCGGGMEGFEDLSLAKSQIARLVRLGASRNMRRWTSPCGAATTGVQLEHADIASMRLVKRSARWSACQGRVSADHCGRHRTNSGHQQRLVLAAIFAG